MSINSNNARTKIYGIYFIADEQVCNDINSQLNEKISEQVYLPKKSRMNIYFKNIADALIVAKYLNKKKEGRLYNAFSTSLESLDRVKDMLANDKMKKQSPRTYNRLNGYRIYNTAEEYIKLINEQDIQK